MAAEIKTNTNPDVSVQLYRSGATFDIPLSSDVRSALRKGGKLLMDPISCSGTAVGADWSTSLVVVSIPSGVTASLPCGSCEMEIKVTISGKADVWITRGIEIVQGLIP